MRHPPRLASRAPASPAPALSRLCREPTSGLAAAEQAVLRGFHSFFLPSPLPACGERSDYARPTRAIRVRGPLHESELLETPPHPDPLSAGGERERTRSARHTHFTQWDVAKIGLPLASLMSLTHTFWMAVTTLD